MFFDTQLVAFDNITSLQNMENIDFKRVCKLLEYYKMVMLTVHVKQAWGRWRISLLDYTEYKENRSITKLQFHQFKAEN